jgi:hypothetical protein
MPRRHALATLTILFSLWHAFVAQGQTAPLLEIHTNTPKWANGCLDLTVERLNTSPQTIYLPEWEGVLFLLFTKRIHTDPSKKDDDVLLPVYGQAISLASTPIHSRQVRRSQITSACRNHPLLLTNREKLEDRLRFGVT